MHATRGAFDRDTMLASSNTAGYAGMAPGGTEERNGNGVLSRDIAAHTGIPSTYLSKILHGLVRSGPPSARTSTAVRPVSFGIRFDHESRRSCES